MDNRKKRVSVEQYNMQIESALKQAREGKTISHEEVINQSKKWWDIISKGEQKAIKGGLHELDNGMSRSHKEVMKKYQK